MREPNKNEAKLEIRSRHRIKAQIDLDDLLLQKQYANCQQIANEPQKAHDLSIKGNSVAIISDGSEVAHLGNIGAAAVLPLLEGQAIALKRFSHLDAWPIAIKSQSNPELIETIRNITPGFGALLLQNIASPRNLEIEERLQHTGIPVLQIEQQGIATVCLTALLAASQIRGTPLNEMRVVIEGTGTPACAITHTLLHLHLNGGELPSVADVLLADSRGNLLHRKTEGLESNPWLSHVAMISNRNQLQGNLQQALDSADVFISTCGLRTELAGQLARMNTRAIIFNISHNSLDKPALESLLPANSISASSSRAGQSGQLNTLLASPGLIQGALRARAVRINDQMQIAAAKSLLASHQPDLSADQILPTVFKKGLHAAVAEAVYQSAIQSQGLETK